MEEKELVSKLGSALNCELELERRIFHRDVILVDLSSGNERDWLSRKGRDSIEGAVTVSLGVSVIDSSRIERRTLRRDEVRLLAAGGGYGSKVLGNRPDPDRAGGSSGSDEGRDDWEDDEVSDFREADRGATDGRLREDVRDGMDGALGRDGKMSSD